MTIISTSWVDISGAPSVGIILQKHGTTPLKLAYAAGTPTSESTFSVVNNEAQVFPAVTGKSIWAIASISDVSVSFDTIA